MFNLENVITRMKIAFKKARLYEKSFAVKKKKILHKI